MRTGGNGWERVVIACISTDSMQGREFWIREIPIAICYLRYTKCLDSGPTSSARRKADQSTGNDFFDSGGGNSRSSSVRFSFVSLIFSEAALSRTCASV